MEILAYCLLDNHIHLIVVPAREDSLPRALKPPRMRYAQHINGGEQLRIVRRNIQ